MGPMIQGKVHHFGPRGLFNGLILIGDDESGSYWDHITGECVHGSMKGERMITFPVEHTTVASALKKWPNLQIAFSLPPLWIRLLRPLMSKRMQKKGFLPPFFRKTMGIPDTRLPEMTSGIGIITNNNQRFYPVDVIRQAGGFLQDEIDGQLINVYIDADDQIPHVDYLDKSTDGQPMQLFTRWYGFSLTYPTCEIYQLS
jgi:hypothetical protein